MIDPDHGGAIYTYKWKTEKKEEQSTCAIVLTYYLSLLSR
jgi:hypothetical protein